MEVHAHSYQNVEMLYGQAIQKAVPHYLLLAKKWQDEDLRWSHSDLDFRIIVTGRDIDWAQLNIACYESHFNLVFSDPLLKRVLEHTAGYVFTDEEVSQRLLPASEALTWSWSHGCQSSLLEWRQDYENSHWQDADEKFYQSVIESRLGCFYLEKDSADNVSVNVRDYQLHCLCWHYFISVRFAQLALKERRFFNGKNAVLMSDQDTKRFADSLLISNHVDNHELLKKIEQYLYACVPQTINESNQQKSVITRTDVVKALGMLRCRPMRYLYYLRPPAGVVTDYLIEREWSEICYIVRVLSAFLPLITDKSVKYSLRDVLEWFPNQKSTVQTLNRFIEYFQKETSTFNQACRLLLTTRIYP